MPSAVYMMQWPLPATAVELEQSSDSCVAIIHHKYDSAITREAKFLLGHPQEFTEDHRAKSKKKYGSSQGSYKQEICWLTRTVGTILPFQWHDINIELIKAFTTSTEGFILSKHMAYSISAASQGNTILPSLVKPNSSWDILRSSLNTVVLRLEYYTKTYGPSPGSYKQQICWLTPTVGTILLVQWQDIGIERIKAFTTSTEGFLLSKLMAYITRQHNSSITPEAKLLLGHPQEFTEDHRAKGRVQL
uniref:Uncharacterized protein n=1 Tax=Leersia perrieri TaxID=77586 RepID=A0A0D9XGA2_9ORYZ